MNYQSNVANYRTAREFQVCQYIDKQFRPTKKSEYQTNKSKDQKAFAKIRKAVQEFVQLLNCEEERFISHKTFTFENNVEVLSALYHFILGDNTACVNLSQPVSFDGPTRVYVDLPGKGRKWALLDDLKHLSEDPALRELPEAIFRYLINDMTYFQPNAAFGADTISLYHAQQLISGCLSKR